MNQCHLASAAQNLLHFVHPPISVSLSILQLRQDGKSLLLVDFRSPLLDPDLAVKASQTGEGAVVAALVVVEVGEVVDQFHHDLFPLKAVANLKVAGL